MSHDFSAGATGAAAVAGCCQAFRANSPIWPSPPDGPINPGSEAPRQNLPGQHSLPLRPLQQRLMRTQRAVGEPPPTTRETEDRLGPQLRRRGVHEDEAAARRQQIMQMAERRADIAHRVQHVGADDEVERSGGEILIGARFSRSKILHSTSGNAASFCSAPGKKPAETSVNV